MILGVLDGNNGKESVHRVSWLVEFGSCCKSLPISTGGCSAHFLDDILLYVG